MATAKGGTHFLLHGPPNPFQARAHPRLPISENPPLAYIGRAGLEVQRPTDTAASEAPIEGLPTVAWIVAWLDSLGLDRDGGLL